MTPEQIKKATGPLPVLAAPCKTCPCRRDTPPGIWHTVEYGRLREFAGDASLTGQLPRLGIFLCHQSAVLRQATVCRGWLTVERDSLAVRLALCRGAVTPEQVAAPALVPLYATGEEAAAAGEAGIARPGAAARRAMARLRRQRKERR